MTRNIVRNMPIKFEVKILNISGVIQNLRFGHFSKKWLKLAKIGPPWGHVTKIFQNIFSQNFPKNILVTLRKFGGPPKSRF